MTNNLESSQSSDGLENQDLSGDNVNDQPKPGGKGERIRKSAQRRSISPDGLEKQNLPKVNADASDKSKRKGERILENALRRSVQSLENKEEPPTEESESQDSKGEQEESAETLIKKEESAEDELFADIRRSLAEEDAAKRDKRERGVLHRVAKLFKSEKTPPAEADLHQTTPDEVDLADDSNIEQPAIEEADILSPKEVDSFFEELIESSHLEVQNEDAASPQADIEESKPLPEAEPGFSSVEAPQDGFADQPHPDEKDAVEKQPGIDVLRPQPETKEIADKFESIREVALEDYSNAPLQPENIPAVTLRQKLRIFIKGLRPFEKVFLVGVISLMVIAGLFSVGFLIVGNLQIADKTPRPTQNLPYPVRVTMPGGWAFDLHKGKVENGKWNPIGAEWLEGTELCKWVAVPWSLQLEAVLRTLKLDDSIELTMSNVDTLKFRVQSIKEVPVDQIGTLEKNSNCLLLILADQKADTRWVVTAIP